jgi:hypothetical protein
LRATLLCCIFRSQYSISGLLVHLPFTLILITVCKLKSSLPMTHPLLELAHIVITRCKVLFSEAMEETFFENSFID